MIQIPLTPEKYAEAREAIRVTKEIRAYTEKDANSGSISTSQVDLDYIYDGITLLVTVAAKRGFAHMTPENTIKARLMALLEMA